MKLKTLTFALTSILTLPALASSDDARPVDELFIDVRVATRDVAAGNLDTQHANNVASKSAQLFDSLANQLSYSFFDDGSGTDKRHAIFGAFNVCVPLAAAGVSVSYYAGIGNLNGAKSALAKVRKRRVNCYNALLAIPGGQ